MAHLYTPKHPTPCQRWNLAPTAPGLHALVDQPFAHVALHVSLSLPSPSLFHRPGLFWGFLLGFRSVQARPHPGASHLLVGPARNCEGRHTSQTAFQYCHHQVVGSSITTPACLTAASW